MIKNRLIKVKNSKAYQDLGYKSNDKYIEIDIKDLSIGSQVVIESECDYCGNVKMISYKEYNSNIGRGHIKKFACSRKCGALKIKEGNLERFGVENVQQIKEVREKTKQTNLERFGGHPSQDSDIRESKRDKMLERGEETSKRIKEFWSSISDEQISEINHKRVESVKLKYGVDYVSQDTETKNKIRETTFLKWGGFAFQSPELSKTIRETLFKNWGVNNPGESKEIRNKAKQTNLERFGFEYASQNKEIRDKIRKTNLDKFGTENPFANEGIKEKIRNTNLDKFGVEYASQNNDVKNQIRETNLERYGNINYSKSESFFNKTKVGMDENHIKYLDNSIHLFRCEDVGHEFEIDIDNYFNRKRSNISLCTICYPIGDSKSLMELELFNWIKSVYSGEIIGSYRDGLEIDIYLPELGIGFEFNGLYWHSDEYKDRNYHLYKLNSFKEKGIRLYMIWEDDWRDRRDIIKSQIKNWIGISSNKIGARKCQVKIIEDRKLVREFLDGNHIQGFINSVIKIGLFYQGELVSIMTFDQFEGRKKMLDSEWNLSRFCNRIGFNVVGGASKLLNYFMNNFKPTRIISFADREWSDGNLYYQLGFKLKYQNKINYKYVINGERTNKQKFTKKKLIKTGLEGSEKEIMEKMGIYRVWDCGQLKFEKLF